MSTEEMFQTHCNLKVTLDRLPLELLRPIMAPLERRDLKSLRLMNRTLRQVASENFFESIIVSRTQPSAQKYIRISFLGVPGPVH